MIEPVATDPNEYTTFADLGLGDEVLRALNDAGYQNPTPIQRQAIPIILTNRDVLGIAQTGTGKTASFTLPMIEVLASGRAKARMPRSVILEPTRELAAQVAENFDKYGKYHRLSKALLIGGFSYNEQEKLIDRGVDVLIATPGRLLDHIERGKVLLHDIKILVIDEADRMLDMGFIPDVEKIASLMPRLRQTLLFSATMPPEIRRLANTFLMHPKEIQIARPATAAATVTQTLIPTTIKSKRRILRQLMLEYKISQALIFCNRKRDVAELCSSLQKHQYNAGALHGNIPQHLRTETLEKFKNGTLGILVCSDVAARGLDIADLPFVINYDVPYHADDYVHRIGRTGRAGRTGYAFTLMTSDDDRYVKAIENRIGQSIPVTQINLPKENEDKSPSHQELQQQVRKTRLAAQKSSSQPPSIDENENTGPIIGLGPYMPAFLLQPVILPNQPSAQTKKPTKKKRTPSPKRMSTKSKDSSLS
ncbi:MAG: DEAD/DEAH box helicase [Alphaproteobacteria bacterium]